MKKKIILSLIICICFFSISIIDLTNKNNSVNEMNNNQVNKNDKNSKENIFNVLNVSELEEETLEVQETENEGFEEQGEIAYNGSDKTPNIELGQYEGLTYYSQIDTRWSSIQYSSTGNTSQTIGSSGCGPTVSSMVVSSIKGKITPDIMSDLYVKYGYRSANQGTYWSAFKWTADVFDIEYTETYKLNDVINMLNQGYYVIVSCNQGLFTYGGHFVVLVGIENDKIKVYDPYLYNTKFETSTRRGLTETKGNTVYVSINNFRNYANYQKFFCFKNDRDEIKENQQQRIIVENNSKIQNVNYQVEIIAKIGLRIRSGASTEYSILGSYSKGENVNIYAENKGWGKTDKGWIYLGYIIKKNLNQIKISQYTVGLYTVNCSRLNVRTGPGTKYRIKTFEELTINARNQGGYVRNVKCTISQILGNWGRTPSGWICLLYCIKIR